MTLSAISACPRVRNLLHGKRPKLTDSSHYPGLSGLSLPKRF
jgi:hypothetical protein